MTPQQKQLIRERMRKFKTTHDGSRTKVYQYWIRWKNKNKNRMPAEWLDFGVWRLQTNPPLPHTNLERKDKNLPFSINNFQWSKVKRNFNYKPLTYRSVTMSQAEWAKKFGVTSAAICLGIKKHKTFANWVENRE